MGTTMRASVPPGHRVYAIGDIHGRADLLALLQAKIAADMTSGLQHWIVYLGDYIDRGPDSVRVLDLIQAPLGKDCNLIRLRGNHEQALLDFLTGDLKAGEHWLQYGGKETLTSYAIPPLDVERPKFRELQRICDALNKAVSPSHVRMLQDMELSWSIGDYIFVHAGMRPGIALSAQASNDLLRIRKGFLDNDHDHGKMIVHGHTITPDIDFRPNRIGIDTGAYQTGCLTALVLEGDHSRFLQTRSPIDRRAW